MENVNICNAYPYEFSETYTYTKIITYIKLYRYYLHT